MTQALYADMNNKRKKEEKRFIYFAVPKAALKQPCTSSVRVPYSQLCYLMEDGIMLGANM
jgi:hypothetical protein